MSKQIPDAFSYVINDPRPFWINEDKDDKDDKDDNSLSGIAMKVTKWLLFGTGMTLAFGATCVYCCAMCVSGLVMASPFLLCNTLLSKSFVLMNITLDKMIENAK